MEGGALGVGVKGFGRNGRKGEEGTEKTRQRLEKGRREKEGRGAGRGKKIRG